MGLAYILIPLVVLVIVIIFAAKWLTHVIGCPCQFCKNSRLTPFPELSPHRQSQILQYFAQREGRHPDESGIFVCEQCETVFDDFSGEKRSQDFDIVGYYASCKTFCKVCNRLIIGCDLDARDVTCRNCGTKYNWTVEEHSKLRFFMPPPGTQVLEKCDDKFGIA